MTIDAESSRTTARALTWQPPFPKALVQTAWLCRATAVGVFADGFAVPLTLGLVSRLVVLLVGYASVWLVPDNPHFIRADYTLNQSLEAWFNWDAGWYTAIAFRGYTNVGLDAPSVAFWPLLPMLEYGLGKVLLVWLMPGSYEAERVAVAALLIVFTAFLSACVALYHLVRVDHGPEVARLTVAILAFSPGAVYFTAPYPAALLLLGTATCLLALRHERWLLAGVAGAFAAAAQVPGCLLVFAFGWAYLERRRRLGWPLLWGLLIPLAPALWLAYLGYTVGDPLAPIHAADTFWKHTRALPWETLGWAWELVRIDPDKHILVAINLAATLAVLCASFWALVRGPRAWAIWGFALIGLYLCVPASEPLEGVIRYSLPALPVWLACARIVRRIPQTEGFVIGLFSMFQGLMVALYVNGYWVA